MKRLFAAVVMSSLLCAAGPAGAAAGKAGAKEALTKPKMSGKVVAVDLKKGIVKIQDAKKKTIELMLDKNAVLTRGGKMAKIKLEDVKVGDTVHYDKNRLHVTVMMGKGKGKAAKTDEPPPLPGEDEYVEEDEAASGAGDYYSDDAPVAPAEEPAADPMTHEDAGDTQSDEPVIDEPAETKESAEDPYGGEDTGSESEY